MPGPFPGMDPYLERRWGDVHARLIGAARDQLNRRLPPDLLCRAEELVVRDESGYAPRRYKPDDFVFESNGLFEPSEPGGGLATLERSETVTVECPPLTERWLEVRTADDERVVTSLEVLSPHNKSGTGLLEFRMKQRGLVSAGVSLVEIDLLRRGGWALYADEEEVPERFRDPYRLAATAAHGGPPRSTFSRVRLREALPALPVPLRPGEQVAVLELQPLVEEVWRTGRYGSHYRGEVPPFPPDDAAWIAERVREWAGRGGPAGGAGGGDPEAAAGGDGGPTAAPAAG